MSDAARLQALEDREAIRQVFTDYAHCLDEGDYAGYAALFAREGRFGDAVGPAAILAQMTAYGARVDAAMAEGRFHKAVHLMSNHDIMIEGDTACADVTWCYMTIDADKVPTVFQMGHYLDDLVREDGAWKVARHTIRRDMGRAQLEAPHPSRLDALEARLKALEEKRSKEQDDG